MVTAVPLHPPPFFVSSEPNDVSTPPLWKASVQLGKAEAANICALLELALPRPQAVLVNEDPFRDWAEVEALYNDMPDGHWLSTLIGRPLHVELLPDVDWIRLSQEGLPPVRAGRFFVFGAHDAGIVPFGVIPIRIEAGMAFGTGHHETTALCLATLSGLARKRAFTNVLDLGCGTGLLGIGAAKLWRRPVMASDIDPVSVAIAKDNARANDVEPLLRALCADGLMHPMLRQAAPFDLILANILAGPLTRLAPQIAAVMAPNAVLVLSGLLRWQENLVLSFYRAQGLVLTQIYRDGSWSALVLRNARS